MAKNAKEAQKYIGGGTELPIYNGQRYHSETAGLEQMALEAINTVEYLNCFLMLAAIKTYQKAAEQREQLEAWGTYYPAAVCFWTGFLEGVRTERQKNRQKKNRQTQATSSGKANS